MNLSCFLPARSPLAIALSLLAACATIQAQVVVNEIMFHPPPAVPEIPAKEWLELYNNGTNTVDLTGWRFTKGIQFSFTNTLLPSGGYLVVAANRATFQANYPAVTNVIGDWTGKLSNGGETIELVDGLGHTVDKLSYAAEGDWALRRIGEVYPGQPAWWRGWQWTTPADGGGKSLELLNPALPNIHGQNWTAGATDGGTPGRANSTATNNIPPIILDVQHLPAIPRSTNTVTVSAQLVDEATTNLNVSVLYRADGVSSFSSATMLDDGLHGDGAAGDGVYGAVLPAQADKTIVEFYVRAADAGGRVRTWPGPTDAGGAQGANALYQVDDSDYTGPQPIYRFIIPAADWNAWVNLMDNVANGLYSNAEMNGTLIRSDGTGTQVRYNVAFRNRGQGTRSAVPHNLNASIPKDHPLAGASMLSFNTRTVHSQAAGNAVFSAAGLPNAYGAAVQVRVNGSNLASATPTGGINSYQFGCYYCFEPYDGDWAANHFPLDSSGNLYKGKSWFDTVQLSPHADLIYLGTNVAAYRMAYATNGPTSSSGAYAKQSNLAEDDWSDLIDLTYALSPNTPDASYAQAVSQAADVDEWLRYFAANSLLINMETTLSTGVGDDYSLYRGILDPRFRLLSHDMDTVLGQGDTTAVLDQSIFKATNLMVLNRLLKDPAIAPRYFGVLKTLADTTFSAAQLNPVLDQALGGWVPDSYIQSMKDTAASRRTNVLSQIPLALTVQSSLSFSNNYRRTTTAATSLSGSANAIETRLVLVNGSPATYVPWRAAWSAPHVTLHPGINRVLIQALNSNSVEFAQTNLDIWYDDGSVQAVGGIIAADTTWTAAGGPYKVTSDLTINNGATLTLQPGTTLYLGAGANITVAIGGRLLAEGTPNAPIRFSVQPGSGVAWGGLTVNGADGSPESRIAYAHLEGNSHVCIEVASGTVFLDHVTFGTTTHQYLSLDGASFLVQNCVFPTGTALFELVHGTRGIKSGGRGIFLRNFFGVAQSVSGNYNDVIDFTGGNRPGPIIHFLDNVFIGATDDLIDLDGTDAWIQGNILMHAHKNGSADTSSAISGGSDSGSTSELTVIGNLIYDCDHAALAKQGNFYTFFNNTIVHQSHQGGLDTEGAVLCLADNNMSEGAGAYFEGNIIHDVEALVRNRTNAVVNFTNNLMPLTWSGPGGNNLTNDPLLNYIPRVSETTNFASWAQAQVMRDWFSLRPGSPALAVGPNGRDLGVPSSLGASISGEPPSVTPNTSATLTVGLVRTGAGIPVAGFPNGSGYTHYKWRLDEGAWSAETPTSTPIHLTNLADGLHHVEVSGKLDSGQHQDAMEFAPDNLITLSRSWTVDSSLPGLRLNEILARNSFTLITNGESPDMVELFNAGSSTVDLSGKGLTDNPTNKFQFAFPPGASLAPGQYLVLFADVGLDPARYLGFGFSQDGGALYLFDTLNNGSGLLDTVAFGPQVPDFSIGRLADGSWGLCQPTFGSANMPQPTGDIYSLKINEWAADVANGPDWFELYNPNPQPVALDGLYLTDKLSNRTKYPIAALTFIGVSTNAYLKFVADSDTAQGPNHVNFSLEAQGEAIGLFPTGTAPAIDSVSFGAQAADVSEGRLPDGTATRGFFPIPSPGEANWLALTNVFINEVLTHTDLPLEDAVELYNASDAPVALSGWGLSDTKRELRKFRIPNGTVIPARGYQTFYEYQFNPNPGSSASFSFNSAQGDEVWLTAYDTNGVTTGYRAWAQFGPQFNGVPFGRVATSVGFDFTAMSAPSFGTSVTARSPTSQIGLFRTGTGAANAYPHVGPVVISEIMYRPPSIGTNDNVQDEFIELHNISGATVPLFDAVYPTNGWRLRDAVNFDFTTPHAIPPGGYLLVVSFDPATNGPALASFRSTYGTNGLVAGPWVGKLSNNGETIVLQAPDTPQTTGPDIGLVPYVTVEQVAYSNLTPWPTNADGSGLSLQRVNFTAYGNDPANWLVATPNAGTSGLIDSDADGIPDTWEDAHGLDKSVNDANLDPDNDGFTNYQEYLAGTDPHSGNSRLHLDGVTPSSDGAQVRFAAAAGRTYSIIFQDALGAGVWQKLADVPAQSSDQSVLVTDSAGLGQTPRFYRLVTPQLP